jgi:hypothetical protein
MFSWEYAYGENINLKKFSFGASHRYSTLALDLPLGHFAPFERNGHGLGCRKCLLARPRRVRGARTKAAQRRQRLRLSPPPQPAMITPEQVSKNLPNE